MILDDVMSELDSDRRNRLIDRLAIGGQSLITAAESTLVPDSDVVEKVSIEDLTPGPPGPEGSE